MGIAKETVLIQHPDFSVSFLTSLDLALLDHAVNDTLTDTDTSTSCADTDDAFLVQGINRLTTSLQRSQNTGQGNGRSRLDIIVEAADLILVLVEEIVCMGILEVLELNKGVYVEGNN